MKIYFVTTNDFKAGEVEAYLSTLSPPPVKVEIIKQDLEEVLVPDIEVIVRKKALEAYKYLALPCVVEHSGLFMKALGNLLPGGLGQIIWDAIGDKMCGFLREGDSRTAEALSIIGYCDGRRVSLHKGKTTGRIAEQARGDYKFNWDPIFIPDESDQTYGEMGLEKKRATSPTVKAWKEFLAKEFAGNHHLK